MITAAIILLVVLALMGAPLYAIILGAAALGFYTLEIELAVLHIDIYQLSNSVVLMALPLFTFAGFLLSESKTADRLRLLYRPDRRFRCHHRGSRRLVVAGAGER